MKTIKILKVLINILYVFLYIILVAAILFIFALVFFNDSLPSFLGGYKMSFRYFNWKLQLIPLTIGINYILFMLSIFYLRKCINSFILSDFYTAVVYKNLKKAGRLFIFIGVSTIVFQMIPNLFMLNTFQSALLKDLSFISRLISFTLLVITSFDFTSVFLIIIGLFLLVFSNSFENAKKLKQENDLTI